MINILLFLYGISVSLPDIAFNVYNTRLRIDDIVMVILFLCAFINWIYYPYYFTKSQIKFLKLMMLFAIFCLLSLFGTLLLGLPFDFYSLARLVGCMLILVSLLMTLKTTKRVIWLGWGLLFGSIIFIGQLIFRWYRITEFSSISISSFYQVKRALAFTTWNANTTSCYAIMFAFTMLLIGCEISGIQKKVFWLVAGALSLVPFFTFSRGASVGIGITWLVFILLVHRYRYEKTIIIMLFIGTIAYLSIYKTDLFRLATYINLSTGQGLSEHDIMWRTALNLIIKSPIIGYGFGQELNIFSKELGRGMAHNAFLSVFIEGGLLGLLLFIWPLGYISSCLWKFAHGKFYNIRAVICFGFLLGIIITNTTYSALYWQKSQMFILSIMVIYLGIVEQFSRIFVNDK